MLCFKILKKTDIEKRLSVPTVKKQCFLNFRGQHKVEFKVRDKNGKVWPFVCSTRKKKGYPKPVLSKGWLQFVRHWRLAIGDQVIFYRNQGEYRIEVIQRENGQSSVVSPRAWNQDADRTMSIASYNKDEEEPIITSTSHVLDQASDSSIEEESTFSLTSHVSAQAITDYQTEWIYIQPVTERVGLKLEFVTQKPHIKVREPKFIDFLELGSQERRGNEQPSFPTLYHMVESPNTSSTAPYYKFL
ncbi:hypothetical protein DITRI_Ditri17bG0071400 [Diplodiscus trichospermus]